MDRDLPGFYPDRQKPDRRQNMLFDVFFLGLPVMFAIIFGYYAVKEASIHFWRPTFCIVAYAAYYLAGGREVVLYFTTAAMMSFGWVSIL